MPLGVNKLTYGADLEAKRLAIVGSEYDRVQGYSGDVGNYWILPDFFTYYYSSNKLPDSFVSLDICMGLYNDILVKALQSAGAKTILGYTDSVKVGYSGDIVESMTNDLLRGSTVGEAWMYATIAFGEVDPSNNLAYCMLEGDTNLTLPLDIINCSFEQALTTGWGEIGNTYQLDSLGSIMPQDGRKMALLTTTSDFNMYSLGLLVGNQGKITKTTDVPSNAVNLHFSYNALTDIGWDPKDFTRGNLWFRANLYDISGNLVAQPKMALLDQTSWQSLSDASTGYTYQTDWNDVAYDITSFRGQKITISFEVGWTWLNMGQFMWPGYNIGALADHVYLDYGQTNP